MSTPRNSLIFPRSSAVYGIDDKAGEVAHFGIPLREQRQLIRGAAVADLSSTRVFQFVGPDRLTWLNTLTSQKIDTLAPGEATETLVLSPTGHIEGWLSLVDDGEILWALSDVHTDEAIPFLDRMRFMLRVEITEVTDSFQAVGFIGAPPEDLETTIVWDDPWPTIGAGSASYAAVDAGAVGESKDHPGSAIDFRIAIVDRAVLRDWQHEGLDVAGRDAWDALRIEAWRPGAPEVDHRALVGELDVLRTAVHLDKGCYRGQEAVARVHNLGQPPRRLVFLHMDGSGHLVPHAGSEIRAEVRGKMRGVGHVTTTALHWELGPIALALVKRNVDIDTPLHVVVRGAEPTMGAAGASGEGSHEDVPNEDLPNQDEETPARSGPEELVLASQELIVAATRERTTVRIPRNPAVDQRRL